MATGRKSSHPQRNISIPSNTTMAGPFRNRRLALASERKSSDSSRNTLHPSKSIVTGSDLAGEIANLALCDPCHKKAIKDVPQAHWYCQECDNFVCHNCKSLHRVFKVMENHAFTSLHPPCQSCERKQINKESSFFCEDCIEFLCEECQPYHKKHTIISCLEKAKSRKTTIPQLGTRQKEEKDDEMETRCHKEVKGSESSETQNAQQQPSNNKKNLQVNETPFTCRATFWKKFDVDIADDTEITSITGSAFLPDSRLLLVDNNNRKLKMFDKNFRFIAQKPLSDEPWDIAVYDSSEVAITVGYRDIVRLCIDGNEIREQGKISLGFEVYGVSYINREKLIVTGIDGDGTFLCLYDTSGRHLSTISLSLDRYAPHHIAMNVEKSWAYVSTWQTGNVISVDMKINQAVLGYQHNDMVWPEGMTVDEYNNLYICCKDSNTILLLLPNSNHFQILLTEEDNLDSPHTITFKPKGGTFIVCSDSDSVGKTAKVYKIKYKTCNQKSTTCTIQ